MRWMWIDHIVSLVPRERLVAIKHVSLAEEHLHDHFGAVALRGALPGRAAMPIMPACFIVEGMAQSAGILVGHAEGFREKVILAKVSRAEFDEDAVPGDTLRYTAEVERMDAAGASCAGVVELVRYDTGGAAMPARRIGRVDLVFSHIDQNLAGAEFPEHNFVFGESFKTLLRSSGIAFE
jgi:3-hydroxyacyl-[acyl-carrier-protein] dehydratase